MTTTLHRQVNRAARQASATGNGLCPYCGQAHNGQLCPRITAIHLYPNGRLKSLSLEALDLDDEGDDASAALSTGAGAWTWEATATH